MENLFSNRKMEEEFTRNYIENMYHFYGYGVFVVCLKENDRIIGRAGISNREVDGVNELELGYMIAKEYQKQGYAFEASKAIMKFAKNQLDAKRMVCFIQKGNMESIHLIEKLGFTFVENIIDSSKTIFAYYIKIL